MAGAHHDDQDLMEPWYIADEISPLEIDTSLTTLVSKRKAKRITPESDKDHKYWSKRKRNNVAAKRSRENKRKIELAIRNRVLVLVEENSLMKKEISVLKTKLGIPTDRSLLTQEEKEQCIRSAQEGLQNTLSNKRSSTRFSQSKYQSSPPRHAEPSENSMDDNDPVYVERKRSVPVYGPVDGMAWTVAPPVSVPDPPPAHSAVTMTPMRDNSDAMMMQCSQQNSQWKYGVNRNHQSSHQFYPHFSQAAEGYYACAESHASVSSPADLSMKNMNNFHGDRDRQNKVINSVAVEPSENAQMNANSSLHDENETLKVKLLQLSAQVEEMKSLILKK